MSDVDYDMYETYKLNVTGPRPFQEVVSDSMLERINVT